MKAKDMKTLAYAADATWVKTLTDQLDELEGFERSDEGSPTDRDGHVIKYTLMGKDVLWAMIHSNGKDYLVRADPNLFEEVS